MITANRRVTKLLWFMGLEVGEQILVGVVHFFTIRLWTHPVMNLKVARNIRIRVESQRLGDFVDRVVSGL